LICSCAYSNKTGSFFDSQILSAFQRSALAIAVGPRWILCYRANRDGFNMFAFHALCGWKGAMTPFAEFLDH
jgi:hypothetical protein